MDNKNKSSRTADISEFTADNLEKAGVKLSRDRLESIEASVRREAEIEEAVGYERRLLSTCYDQAYSVGGTIRSLLRAQEEEEQQKQEMEQQTVTVSVRIDKDIVFRIEEYAKLLNVSKSFLLRSYIEAGSFETCVHLAKKGYFEEAIGKLLAADQAHGLRPLAEALREDMQGDE
ncbi:hypothetical protein [Ruficoccus sp. ZRK36]|uniref:hypothetical protein n=1 Tax=Ruficoccus sp. ZRK36 TaxID=2866311 RepID=UPI001C736178|nr:hypothetical protein [Ruficoccus sp. ZRK36]QYY34916.1 hypothetical protein K0V07_11445 [Ruficoccus sp. ZRK36]